MSETDGMFYGGVGLVLVIVAGVIALAWLVLPFILIAQLKAIREAVALASRQAAVASERQAQALVAIETATRQTAEACAALTQWQAHGRGE